MRVNNAKEPPVSTHGLSTINARISKCELRLALSFSAFFQGGYIVNFTGTQRHEAIHFTHAPCLTGFDITEREGQSDAERHREKRKHKMVRDTQQGDHLSAA